MNIAKVTAIQDPDSQKIAAARESFRSAKSYGEFVDLHSDYLNLQRNLMDGYYDA